MYIDIFHRFRDAPQKRRTNSWSLLHDNAPGHRSVLVKHFLAKNNVITLEHSPCSPDLSSVDFYLFTSTEISIERSALL